MKKFKSLFKKMLAVTALGVLCALAVQPGHAALQSQVDTNALVVNSTNFFVLTGDQTGFYTNGQSFTTPVLDGSKTTQAWGMVGGFFTNTAAGPSNIVFFVSGSVDGGLWTNNVQQVTVVVPAATTNWCYTTFAISAPYPLYGLRAVANTNTALVTGKSNSQFFKLLTKTGL